MDRNYDVISFISKYFYSSLGVANFADIMKIAMMLIKAAFKDSIKVKIIRKIQ